MSKKTLDFTDENKEDEVSFEFSFADLPENVVYPVNTVGTFEIVKADVKTSSSGNPMLVLHVKVNVQGEEITLFDNLVWASQASERIVKQKLKQLEIPSNFRGTLYSLSEELIGKTGSVKLGVSKAVFNENNVEIYPIKNVIKSYSMQIIGDLLDMM